MQKAPLLLTCVATLFAAFSGQLYAGQSAQTSPAFEVASVKLNRNPPVSPSGARVISLRLSLSHGRLTFEALSLRNLLLQAYDIQRNQITGCPSWCDSDMFDVAAKAEDDEATAEQVRLMLQTLLVDRFKLVLRREKQELPGYALTVSRNGPKLKVASDEEVTGASLSGYRRTFQKIPIAGLVNYLANSARQPVVDNTGLKGAYDFTIDLTPPENDPLQAAGIPAAADPSNGFARLLVAVEDQLGLKLEPRKIPIENFIIDHAEHPSEN